MNIKRIKYTGARHPVQRWRGILFSRHDGIKSKTKTCNRSYSYKYNFSEVTISNEKGIDLIKNYFIINLTSWQLFF